MIKLIVAYKHYESNLFLTNLDNIMKLVDWSSNDPKDVLEQIYKCSYDRDSLGSILPPDDDDLTPEGLRNHTQAHAQDLLRDIEYYPELLTYYVDLIHWDQKPPSKINTELRILPLLQIYKLEEPDLFEISLSLPIPYKDVHTREIEQIKTQLGIKKIYPLKHEQVRTENLNALKEHYIEHYVEHHKNPYKDKPVLVYVKDNETTLKSALQDYKLYDVANELWS